VTSYLREHWQYLNRAGGYPGVDGLRAAAMLAVVFFHFGLFQIGWMGVDLFFVISGFLIGGMIIDGLQAGRFRSLVFYRNRALRILPVYYFFILLSVLVKALLLSTAAFDLGSATKSIASALFFYQTTGPYFFGLDIDSHYVPGGSWSLVIEEYFYLLFPWLALALYSSQPKRRDTLLIVLCGLVLLGPVVRLYATRQFNPTDFNWYLASSLEFHSHYDELLAGVLAALIVRRFPTRATNRPLLFGMGVAALIGFYAYLAQTPNLAVASLMTRETLIYPTLCAGAFASIMLAVYNLEMRSRIVVIIARLSFPMYLSHIFLLETVTLMETRYHTFGYRLDEPAWQLGKLCIVLVMSYVISLCVEYPFLRLYHRRGSHSVESYPRSSSPVPEASSAILTPARLE